MVIQYWYKCWLHQSIKYHDNVNVLASKESILHCETYNMLTSVADAPFGMIIFTAWILHLSVYNWTILENRERFSLYTKTFQYTMQYIMQLLLCVNHVCPISKRLTTTIVDHTAIKWSWLTLCSYSYWLHYIKQLL